MKSIVLNFAIFFSTALISANAQQCIISGKVSDIKGNPVSYANIYLKNSIEGCISNEKGNFKFKSHLSGNRILICSYMGYANFEKEINLTAHKNFTINIILQKQAVKGKRVTVYASSFTAGSDDEEKGVTLTAMDVVRTPGSAADIFWAVKSFPGLQQVEEGAGLFVRGGDVSETAIYLDGALLKHPYKYESPTGGFFGTFSPFLLKGTYFSSGGFSAEYGNALSGILSMQSLDMPRKQEIGFGVGLAAESFFFSSPIIKNKFGFSLSGNISNTEMMFKLNKSRKKFSKYPFSYDFNLNSVYQFNNQSQLKLFIFREDDKVGTEVEHPVYSTEFNGEGSNRLYNLQYKGLAGKNVLIKANAAFSSYIQKINLGVMDLDLEDRLLQGRIIGEINIKSNLTIKTGFELYEYCSLISGTVSAIREDVNPDAESITVDTDYSSKRFSQIFDCNFLSPFGFKIIFGLRGMYESISKKYYLDPRISIVFPLTLNTSLTAAFGKYCQNPEPKFYDRYIGNSKLTAMRATHKVVGFFYKKENRIFRVEVYRKDYENLLLEDEQINYSNNGYGYSKGVDLFAKNSFGPVSGWISYSWLESQRKWMDLPLLASPYFDITNNLNIVIISELPNNFSIGLRYRYATGKPYTPAENSYHTVRVPDFKKLDMNISWMNSFFGSDRTIIYAAVSNILGRVNIFDYKYSSDFTKRTPVESSFGRSVYFGIQVNI